MAFKYNKTQFNWDKVKQHLLNQGNISVDIQDLQDKLKAFNKHLDVISGLDFLDTVADNLSFLNPLKQIKTFGYGIALVQFSRSVMSNSLRSHELQHARPSCPSK